MRQEHHLRVERTPDNRVKPTIQAQVKLGRRAIYSLMGADLYGLNGVGPRVLSYMVITYITPMLASPDPKRP